jgi:hypothetical protein
MKMIYKQAAGVWVLLLVLAIANGILRSGVYGPKTDELLAHQISTVTIIFVFLVVMYVFFSRTGAEYTLSNLITIGVVSR